MIDQLQDTYTMVYLIGILGFIGGFILGVMLIGIFLKSRSKQELMENKSIRWTYGVFVWFVAGLTAWAAVTTYNQYF
ncbi:MAG: hypothetical protein AAF569_02320 [Pseudomonadota bacterium]